MKPPSAIAVLRLWLIAVTCTVAVWAAAALAVDGDAEPATVAAGETPAPTAEQAEFFERQVRPILVARCHECHSGKVEEPKGSLRLDGRRHMLTGGDTGPAIVPGKPDESLLIDAINYRGDYEMPPKSKLPAAEIEVLTRWVAMGAPWPGGAGSASGAGGNADEPDDNREKKFDLAQRKAEHWAWQPVAPPAPPEVADATWPRSPIDRFILRPLEAAKLAPAPPADKATLLRRAYFDLAGLPPMPDDVEAFLANDSPDAFERVVDRLLASPAFGERWARHWLDLMRYAETRGHEFDFAIPNAYEYRDYVIRALNADVPYDLFVTEHVAGDLVRPPRFDPATGANESILGTAFWHLGEGVHSPVDIRKDETDRIDNALDVLSKTFLAMTVSCARCHDHKFDAISTRDYYALAGYMQSAEYRLAAFDTLEHNLRVAEEMWRLDAEYRPRLLKAFADRLRPGVERTADYLLAATEAIDSHPGDDRKPDVRPPESFAELYKVIVDEIAEARGLNAVALLGWVEQTLSADAGRGDLLALWREVALDSAAGKPRELSDRLEAWLARGGVGKTSAAAALADARVIFDYADAPPEHWLPDGPQFGPRAVRPGDVRLAADEGNPIAGVVRMAAAERDPAFEGMKLAPGVENDPARIESTIRVNRSIRTPTFGIASGRVWALVRGGGAAYAVVDSHRLNNGPLHAALVQQWQARGDGRPQWVGWDLTAYKEHRAHIEFSAGETGDFAVMMVVESDSRPGDVPLDDDVAASAVTATTAEAAASADGQPTLARLAAKIEVQLVETLGLLANDRIVAAEDAAGRAAAADWMVRHAALFETAGEHNAAFVSLAKEFADKRRARAAGIRRPSRVAPAMWEGSAEDERLLIRGNSNTPGPVVPRRFLEALGGAEHPADEHGSGRLELARRIADRDNPLTARVMANRLWHHLMGRGIVASVDNFGVLGEKPTHPELLDYLGTRLVDDAWSLKSQIRSLVGTSTYRMASRGDDQAEAADPTNRLWHRAERKRLSGEAIRDAMLTVSGRIDRRMYGRSVNEHLTEFLEGRGRPASGPLDGAGRRSVYIAVRRNFLSPMMMAFDTPPPVTTVGRRNVSNVPAQALMLLNGPLVAEQALVWANRVLADGRATPRERIDRLYHEAFARGASEEEIVDALAFLELQGEARGVAAEARANDPQLWADLCHVLFNVKEFVFVN